MKKIGELPKYFKVYCMKCLWVFTVIAVQFVRLQCVLLGNSDTEWNLVLIAAPFFVWFIGFFGSVWVGFILCPEIWRQLWEK